MNPLLVKAGLTVAGRFIPGLIAVIVLLAITLPLLLLVALMSMFGGNDDDTTTATTCTVTVGTSTIPATAGTRTTGDLAPDWQTNTTAILAVVDTRITGPDRDQARVITLATAMQESRLGNLNYGDRDSVGLFQQRPSQGWGTVAQIMDPAYATGKFLDNLIRVPNWSTLPVTVAAQKVQRSGHPTLYAQWESLARQLAGGTTTNCTPAIITGGDCDTTINLTGYANGLIPPAALCPLPSSPGQMLRSDAANAFTALNTAYRAQFGRDICVTDSYRSLASQIDVKKRKPGLAAKPGTSKHGLGIALDLGCGIQNFNTPQYRWMDANAPRYGWVNPDWARPGGSGPLEAWHWQMGEA